MGILNSVIATLPSFRRCSFRLPRGTRMRCGMAALAVVCALAFCAPDLVAKQKKVSRTVSGAVLDEADNGIAGASVQLSDLQTGRKIAIYSQEGGHYQFADLQPTHDYEVQASFQGASSEVRKVSSADIRTRIVLNLTIPGKKP